MRSRCCLPPAQVPLRPELAVVSDPVLVEGVVRGVCAARAQVRNSMPSEDTLLKAWRAVRDQERMVRGRTAQPNLL